MSMGAWAMTLFGGLGAAAVAADLTRRPRLARTLGGANAVVGGYFGSYTGVLLSSTAVPVWGPQPSVPRPDLRRHRRRRQPARPRRRRAARRPPHPRGTGSGGGGSDRHRPRALCDQPEAPRGTLARARAGGRRSPVPRRQAGRSGRARPAARAKGPPSPTISPACCTSPGASPSATPGWRPGGARPPTMGRSRAAPVGSSSEEPVVAERDLAREALHQVQSQPPVSICHSYTNHGEGSSNSCCCAGRNRVNAAWATARFRALMRRI
jgi:hypothetical protein